MNASFAWYYRSPVDNIGPTQEKVMTTPLVHEDKNHPSVNGNEKGSQSLAAWKFYFHRSWLWLQRSCVNIWWLTYWKPTESISLKVFIISSNQYQYNACLMFVSWFAYNFAMDDLWLLIFLAYVLLSWCCYWLFILKARFFFSKLWKSISFIKRFINETYVSSAWRKI